MVHAEPDADHPRYEKAVVAFFDAVEAAHVTRVAIDLRKNSGGASLAAVPFLQYMGVKRYRDYRQVQSLDRKTLKAQFAQLEAYLKKTLPSQYTAGLPAPPTPAADRLFHGRLYLVTGPGCFSSAMEFAADIKYNHIGTIVGRSCGETVTGPGEVREFIADSPSGVPFQVVTKVYRWPGLPSGTQVEPDVPIPLSMKDVRRGVDPVKAWFDANRTCWQRPAAMIPLARTAKKKAGPATGPNGDEQHAPYSKCMSICSHSARP